jgi:hypothetical protein
VGLLSFGAVSPEAARVAEKAAPTVALGSAVVVTRNFDAKMSANDDRRVVFRVMVTLSPVTVTTPPGSPAAVWLTQRLPAGSIAIPVGSLLGVWSGRWRRVPAPSARTRSPAVAPRSSTKAQRRPRLHRRRRKGSGEGHDYVTVASNIVDADQKIVVDCCHLVDDHAHVNRNLRRNVTE